MRGIALTPTQGLTRGMAVKDTGGPLKVPVGKAVLSHMFDVFGQTLDREPALADVRCARCIVRRPRWPNAPPDRESLKRVATSQRARRTGKPKAGPVVLHCHPRRSQ